MIDALDLKIINALKKDARIPFVDIAKQLKVSPGVVQARYAKMKKTGLIKGTTLLLYTDEMKKPYVASLGVNALEPDLSGVIKYIQALKIKDAKMISWITFGRYNIAAIIISKNLIEIHKVKQQIMQHPSVKEASINLNTHWWIDYDKLNLEKNLLE